MQANMVFLWKINKLKAALKKIRTAFFYYTLLFMAFVLIATSADLIGFTVKTLRNALLISHCLSLISHFLRFYQAFHENHTERVSSSILL